VRSDGRGLVTEGKCRMKQCSNPTQKWINGGFKSLMATARSHYRELLKGPMEKMRKISHVLATDQCHESIQHSTQPFNRDFYKVKQHFHELTLLMSFEVITLKTAGNNVSKQC